MHIDQTHRPWIGAAVMFGVGGALAYVIYALRSPIGATGGSAMGLTFGIVGYAFMLYAGFLGLRKKVPTWRLGKGSTWMRGHLWLGLVSLLIILYHGGFAWRGPLTAVMMYLFFFVIASGILGAALQHYLPRVILTQVPKETIYEEIPHVRTLLLEEADDLVMAQVEAEREDKDRIQDLYKHKVRPFLEKPDDPKAELAVPDRAAGIFRSMRTVIPVPLHPVIDDLESICEEERQLNRQAKLYRWLHAWLLVHVPLSVALLVLGGVHAVVALRY